VRWTSWRCFQSRSSISSRPPRPLHVRYHRRQPAAAKALTTSPSAIWCPTPSPATRPSPDPRMSNLSRLRSLVAAQTRVTRADYLGLTMWHAVERLCLRGPASTCLSDLGQTLASAGHWKPDSAVRSVPWGLFRARSSISSGLLLALHACYHRRRLAAKTLSILPPRRCPLTSSLTTHPSLDSRTMTLYILRILALTQNPMGCVRLFGVDNGTMLWRV